MMAKKVLLKTLFPSCPNIKVCLISLSTFISLNKDKAEGVLLDVEPLYAAVTFGLLALDIFTTTRARLNELL